MKIKSCISLNDSNNIDFSETEKFPRHNATSKFIDLERNHVVAKNK